MKQVNKKKQDIKKHFKKMKNYISKFINGNWPILIIMIISLILHVLAIKQLGFNYTLNSDRFGRKSLPNFSVERRKNAIR